MQQKLGVRQVAATSAFIFAAATLGATAYAQSEQSTQRMPIEEVVVTAERRTESLQTSALSATVLNEEMLQKKGVIGLTTVQYAVPGILITDYSSANTFNIRGIGQAQVDIDLPSGVVIYRDGVPTLTGYFQNAPYYDMASVEVLRGPQGTFAGKAAAAGAMFVRTRDPELERFGGSIMAGAGNEGFFETTGVLNVPVGDTLAVRVSGHYERRDSLFDSIRTNPLPGGTGIAAGPYYGSDDRDLKSMRIGVHWEPTDQFYATFKLDHDDLYFGNHGTTGLDPLTGREKDIRDLIANGQHKYRDEGERASLKLAYELENGIRIESLTGYSTVDTRANRDVNAHDPQPFGFRAGGTFENLSQEIDILSAADQRVRWVVGAFWQDYTNDIPSYRENGIGFDIDLGTRLDYTTPWKKDETSYAFFGQLEFDITDTIELQVGARWNRYEYDQFTNFEIDLFNLLEWSDPTGDGIGTEGALLPFENGGAGTKVSDDEDSVDWKINVNWMMNENNFLYALVSRGHTPGSANLFDLNHNTYDEMSVINYETGWKATFLDQQVRTQFNVYYQVFDDYQANFQLVGVGGIPITVGQFQNAETDSIVYGAEFGMQAYIDNFEIDAGVAYFKSELGSFGIVTDPFALMTGGPGTVNLDGSETPFAPEVTGNIGVGYRFVLAESFFGDSLEMTPRVDVAYRRDAYAGLFQNRATLLEGYTLLNAQVQFRSGNWSAVLWGTNLTDEEYVGAKQNVGAADASATVPFNHFEGLVYGGLRRLFGLRVTFEF
jgi:iron complex outermembrane receptor protein